MEHIKNYLLENYNALSYTHNYIFGISYKKMVYAVMVEKAQKILPEIVSVDKASTKNGGGYSLKFLQNKEKIAILFSHASEIIPICSLDYFENLVKNSKLNRGQMFENLVISYYQADTPKQKNAKFTECGDCIIREKHYQIKYHKATFTNETTLQNLLKRQNENSIFFIFSEKIREFSFLEKRQVPGRFVKMHNKSFRKF